MTSERPGTALTESAPPMSATMATNATMAATCCAATDRESSGACALCERPICKNCRGVVNGRTVCAACRQNVVAELRAEQVEIANVPAAALGGVVAAILCGAAWAAMVVVTNFEIGYAAVGVGIVVGYGVLLGARKKRGRNLQWIALACSVLGLLLGKYFTIAHLIIANVEGAKELSHFDPRLVEIFFRALPDFLSPFDALWVFIALRVAWKIPKPTTIQVG